MPRLPHEEKVAKIQEKKSQLEAELRKLQAQQNQKNRKKRDKCFIHIGIAVESVLKAKGIPKEIILEDAFLPEFKRWINSFETEEFNVFSLSHAISKLAPPPEPKKKSSDGSNSVGGTTEDSMGGTIESTRAENHPSERLEHVSDDRVRLFEENRFKQQNKASESLEEESAPYDPNQFI